jgi:hypothetical protein
MAVRELLRRMGWKELGAEQTKLELPQAAVANPNLSAFCSPDQASPSPSQDQDPTDRRGDRLLACLGLWDDAPPLFGSGASIPRAGVLLVLPAWVQNGIFECAGQINDNAGDPLFVVTAQANAGLVKMLPVLLLEEGRVLVGERRVTVVFDRGGYSPKLFQQILDANFDLLTYRKGRYRPIGGQRFRPRWTRVNGRTMHCVLADQEVRLLKGKLRLRQVTRRKENGHQTPILTPRRDLSAPQVAYGMFNRWRQENFFKYLREEYALDAWVEYAAVPDEPSREVPNPVWATVNAQLRQAQACVDRLQAQYGLEAWTHLEHQRPTLRGFKLAHATLSQKLAQAWQRVLQLEQRRAAVPRRVPVQSLTQDPVVKLAPERQHLTNLIKMVACQAESELLRLVAPHYRRVQDEGRTLIQSALAAAADLQVTQTKLRVTLAPLSSAHRSRAVEALCQKLNLTKTLFPGSRLRLRYAIREAF